MLQIWQRLYKLSPILFAPDLTGPFCQRGSCMEKQMSCQNPISKLWMPSDILKTVLEPTLNELAILGGIVVLRTVLSVFLNKEIKELETENKDTE